MSALVGGCDLSINDVVKVSRYNEEVKFTDDPSVWQRVDASYNYIQKRVQEGEAIYGVTTGFGGMADIAISPENASELQENLLYFTKAGAGQMLAKEDIRAAMLLRCSSHLKGASGVRSEIIERFRTFLNHNVTPCVLEYGSIGASGDLIPLSSIAGAIYGLNESFKVDFDGQVMSSIDALKKLNLQPKKLMPKEGLAMINGTSVMTGIAANCVYDGRNILSLVMGCHAFFLQALCATNQSFHPFINAMKPHHGQKAAGSIMLKLLDGSKMIRNELKGDRIFHSNDLIQDRYGSRCLAQYIGPIIDAINNISKQVEVEANSATDNPLIDVESMSYFHNGNFLGQYIGTSMDQLRYNLALLVKHLDVQIASTVSPEFSRGLSASLVGNSSRKVNMGLKGLQICGNSLVPLIEQLSGSLADRFPTYAEQFNQNINSQGFGSASLSRKSADLCWQYIAVALIFAVQAVELRSKLMFGSYDARVALSDATKGLYTKVKGLLGSRINPDKSLIWNDNEQALDEMIAKLYADLKGGRNLVEEVAWVVEDF